MRKPAFCICENKDADQLHGSREVDQRLCFRYTDSTIPLLPKSKNFKLLSIFCGCIVWFVSKLVENPEDWLSQNEAHLVLLSVWHRLLHMSLVVRKPIFGVSDQVLHKPGCAATEDG